MEARTLVPVLNWIHRNNHRVLRDLSDLVSIQSVSTDPRQRREVLRGANLTCRLMRQAGLEKVRLIRVDNSSPYACGEWLRAPDSPTLFLYAHQDVQPAGSIAEWKSSPWRMTIRGRRLYGRGTADDKGAIVAQLAVISGFLKTLGRMPVNVKMVVESEEEIGSPNLDTFFKQNKDRLRSDAIVVCDTENLATGLPSITHSLRGIVQILVEVESAVHAVHSGIGGGLVADAALALNVILGRLYHGDRRPGIPALERAILPLSRIERKLVNRLPGNERSWREEFGILPNVHFANDPRLHPYEQTWRRPSMTVIAQEAGSIEGRSNQILPQAAAVISCRTVPNQTSEAVFRAIRDVLIADPPWNVRVTVKLLGSVNWWLTDPRGPAFEAARTALKLGFGKTPTVIGSGGSIGFIRPLSELFGGAPALLLGIGDPRSNPHAENESLHLGDLHKLTRSLVYLFDLFGRSGSAETAKER